MNKICGYSCEHNKSGVCQIPVCDKRLITSDKTEIKHLSKSYYDLHEKYYKLQKENKILKQNAENNNKVVDKITYTIKPSFTTRKLKQLQKENEKLKQNAENNDKVVDKVNWENQLLKKENKQLKIQISAREEVCNRLEDNWNKLNQKYLNAVADYEKTMFEKEQLKKQLEEKDKPQIFIDTQNIEERYAEGLYQDYLEEENKKYKDQQKDFINYLENEKDRLARECSQIYEDSLGKTRLVNEDIFDEVNDILRKYKDIIGDDK